MLSGSLPARDQTLNSFYNENITYISSRGNSLCSGGKRGPEFRPKRDRYGNDLRIGLALKKGRFPRVKQIEGPGASNPEKGSPEAG